MLAPLLTLRAEQGECTADAFRGLWARLQSTDGCVDPVQADRCSAVLGWFDEQLKMPGKAAPKMGGTLSPS